MSNPCAHAHANSNLFFPFSFSNFLFILKCFPIPSKTHIAFCSFFTHRCCLWSVRFCLSSTQSFTHHQSHRCPTLYSKWKKWVYGHHLQFAAYNHWRPPPVVRQTARQQHQHFFLFFFRIRNADTEPNRLEFLLLYFILIFSIFYLAAAVARTRNGRAPALLQLLVFVCER